MKRSCHLCFLLCLLILSNTVLSCTRGRPLDASDLRGLSKAELQQKREAVLARHADGRPLSGRETAYVEQLREQERRLDNSWIFGEWRERHGSRLIFRDDGTVSVGARGGTYDEWGVYHFISPEEPSYESVWTVGYDAAGDPVIYVARKDGSRLIYPCHRSRNSFSECAGDLETASETGFYFTKIQ
ncbi:MAG: hypothetical protein IJL93_03180 [Bacteroidales bacterium]|nr:hypothetical protein [Bacteroidales bacterium]